MQVWPYMPQKGLTESLEWLTDVIRCKAGEDRVALRHLPRQTYMMTCWLDPAEYGAAKFFARTQSQEFLVPMWQHYVNTGSLAWGQSSVSGDFDADVFVAGGQALVWQDNQTWKVVEVLSRSAGGIELTEELPQWYVNACVVPLQVVRWAQAPEFVVSNNDVRRAELRVKAVGAVQLSVASPFPQHRGVDVLTDPNVLVREVKEQHYRELDETDNMTGIIVGVERYGAPETQTTMSWHPLTRQELKTTLQWVHSRKGRRHAFWYLSHNPDLVARSALGDNPDPLAPGTDLIEVTDVLGLSASVPFDVSVRHSNGARRFYRVQAVKPASVGRVALVLTGNAGVSWPLSSIAEVNLMTGVRFDADRVEIRYTQGGAATISVPIVEVPGL